MAARVNSRRWAVGALALVLALVSDASAAAAEPVPPAELRARAEAAEQAGDWEAAFTLYCQLYVADRSATPDLRDRLAGAFRRVQQLRRHRDPAYQSFAASLQPGDALTLYAELVTRLGQVYAEPARSAPQVLWTHGVEEFDRALGNPAFVAAFLDDPSPARIESFRLALRSDWARRPVRTAKEARATLRLLMNEAQDRCPLRLASAVVVEFLCGSCTGLDEYTVYLNPAMTTPDLAAADLSEYGVYLTSRNDQLVVAGVAAGSWAAHNTNLRKGDRVTRINGRPIETGCVAAAAEALRMPLGGFHEVETAPPAPDMLPGLARLPVTLPTVYAADIISKADGIGYVRVGTIGADTPREIDQAVECLRAKGLRALVLDLRGNHGGNFLAGVEVAKRFLPSGVVVATQGQLGEVANRAFSSDSGAGAIDVPLVVLIDTETASAAEVVAAALKDNGRATLVGMPTFGKGSVQYPLRLGSLDDPADPMRLGVRSGSVRLTIARLVAPGGSPINGVGVAPQVVAADPDCQLVEAVQQARELAAGRPPARE